MSESAKYDRKSEHVKSIPLLKRCLGYFKPYSGKITIAILAMLMVSAAEGGTAYIVKPAFDEGLNGKDMKSLMFVALAAVGIFSMKAAGRYVQNYLMRYSALKVLEQLRNEMYDKMIFLPMKFFEREQVGNLMSRIIQDVILIRSSLPAVVMMVREIITMLALVGVVFYQDWYLAIWAVLVLPVAIIPIAFFGRKLRKLGRKNQVKLADISVFLQEVFSGVRVVKAFHTERKEGENFRKENGRLVKIAIKEVIYSELSSPVMDVVGAIGAGAVLIAGGMRVIDGHMTVGGLMSFLAALGLLYAPVKKFTSANLDVQRALAGAERVFEILDSTEIVEEKDGTVAFEPPLQEVEFRNITFAYEDCATPALDNVSFTVRAGERVAIVGPSGAGKTTFVNLIPRFYEQQGGQILINGKDVRDYTLATLRRNIAMVSQDAFLFNISVRDNIAYGQAEINDEAVFAAARAAYAHDFIEKLPEGYNAVVGERGTKLSGGQKQRLTIARAILKNAPLLILDEATSALDSESERIVQKALENLMAERTSIVIAHRLSTVLSADRILVMDKGRIASQGRHEDLLGSCPLYTKLYEMQFNTPEPVESATCVMVEETA
ncbi:ABC transporter ATP-binding protein/permease [Desulfovibrio mangrovi]|uniref:ABC transporter ATP-binding protein n=1 Tax=Desulfovibrio mangrovi TaxID=2976983 RepID=UPI002248290D|nr:ABC transporter transmembrane domain-containing protein [Desulfovibrio mangrovi]UZP68285.1 ABC transporter ATP-binding protein/permease [Desulfovibrio mangrovi]